MTTDRHYSLHDKIWVHLREGGHRLAPNYEHYWRWGAVATTPPLSHYQIREYSEFVLPASYSQLGSGRAWPTGVDFHHERYALTWDGQTLTEYTTYANRATNLYLQLLLTKRGISLIHAAGIAIDGQGIIFPAGGGVGKTTLVCGLKTLPGFSFLGDDFVMLDREGVVWAYPSDLSVYPYHIKGMPELKGTHYERYLTGRTWINRLTNPFPWARGRYYLRRGVSKLIAWVVGLINPSGRPVWHQDYAKVPVEQVVGSERIGNQARLSAAIFLQRHNGSDFRASQISIAELVAQIDGILGLEFRYGWPYWQSLALATNQIATDLNVQQRQILAEGLKGARLYRVEIPTSATPEAYIAFMKDFIQQNILAHGQ